MARPRKVQPENVASTSDLAEIVAAFKARFPDEWEAIRLGPTQHGIEQMIEALNR